MYIYRYVDLSTHGSATGPSRLARGIPATSEEIGVCWPDGMFLQQWLEMVKQDARIREASMFVNATFLLVLNNVP
jgi:hypothetical protein